MKNLSIILIILFSFNIFASAEESPAMPAFEKVNGPLDYEDDLDFEHVLLAIQRQLKYFDNTDLSSKFKFGQRTLRREHLKNSLLVFRKLIVDAMNCFQISTRSNCLSEFNLEMNGAFEAYRPVPEKWERGYKENKTMFTAYYSPDFEGSYTKTEVYKNPIYAYPKNTADQKLSSDEINYQGKLANKGLEIVYVKESLYDIWLMHVEGGARVLINTNGVVEKKYLSYVASNNQSFEMLYKYMIAEGMLQSGATKIANQREYFLSHPQDQRRILNSSPSFIFFRLTEEEPVGVKNIPLTENRSIATDYRRVKEYGFINFIKTKRPFFENNQVNNKDFSRFFINQDTGGAIKGAARVDLYFGYGKKAELASNYVYGLGEQYYIILK